MTPTPPNTPANQNDPQYYRYLRTQGQNKTPPKPPSISDPKIVNPAAPTHLHQLKPGQHE